MDLWGPGEASLREQLLEARGPARKLAVLAAALQRHLDPTPPDPAMAMAAAALRRGAAVAAVASRLGLLPGTFVRRFRAATGLAPKRFARVQRLQRLVATASTARGRCDWAQIAAEHGYADQAHLIHDFRDLTGLTPTEYRDLLGCAQPSARSGRPMTIFYNPRRGQPATTATCPTERSATWRSRQPTSSARPSSTRRHSGGNCAGAATARSRSTTRRGR